MNTDSKVISHENTESITYRSRYKEQTGACTLSAVCLCVRFRLLDDAGSSESCQCTVAGVDAEHLSLTDFLTRCVSLTQIGDTEERAQGMDIVTATLTRERRLTWEHSFVELQEEGLIRILEKCFEFKMMPDYLVPGLFSTNALNSKCWKII